MQLMREEVNSVQKQLGELERKVDMIGAEDDYQSIDGEIAE
jgi:hypothetical protein